MAGTGSALFGTSLGGLFALYALLTDPASFDRYVIGSPAIWWDGEMLFDLEARQANIWLAMALGTLGDQVTPGDLNIRLSSEATPEALREMLEHLDPAALQLGDQIAQGAIDRLKFSEALPEEYARVVVERRMRVDEEVRTVAGWAMRFVVLSD
jgi:pimeloyl-ACP methyl ester carboxylesterase